MKISEKIRLCRKELRYTQQELATIVGVSKRSIAYYEAGQRTPSLYCIKMLAKVFKVSVTYLLLDSELDAGDRYLDAVYHRALVA